MMRGVEIAVEGLACRRGERLLFEGLAFTAKPGAFVEIVGPNGAGKTSLLRILAGLMTPEGGTIRFNRGGKPLERDEEPSALLHHLGHLDALKSQLTARENMAFAGAIYGVTGHPAAALARLGLRRQADLPVGYFSAGQRRRLALARCLLLGRPLWLLDEPTASLDSAGKALVAALIAAHTASGGTVIAATHETLLPGATQVTLA